MAIIIKRPSRLTGVTVYFAGNSRWSDDRSDALELDMTPEEVTAMMVNTDGTNGGWSGATTETV